MPASTGIEHDVEWNEGTKQHTASDFDVARAGPALAKAPALLHRKHAEKYSRKRNAGHGTDNNVNYSSSFFSFFFFFIKQFCFVFKYITIQTQD